MEDDNLDYEEGNSNVLYGNVETDFLLHRNLDVDLDFYCNELQKDIKRLPSNLRAIKELIYEFILPKVEGVISYLENIKQTTNYDENIPFLPFSNIIDSQGAISAVNCFNNHTIKGKFDNKIVYGTASGDIFILDLDSGRTIVSEKKVFTSRIEIIKTSTVKYFDTFISRIIVSARGNSLIHIYSYNHSYSSIILDDTLNLSTNTIISNVGNNTGNKANNPSSLGKNNQNQIQEDCQSLSNIISNINLSKDSFFMVITTLTNLNYIYKFNDIPSIALDKLNLKEDTQRNFNINPINQSNYQSKGNNLVGNTSFQNNIVQNNEPFVKLIGTLDLSITQNFSFFQLPNKQQNEVNINIIKEKKQVKQDLKEKDKEKDKKGKDMKKLSVKQPDQILLDQVEEPLDLDYSKYNIRENYENGNDYSALQPRSENHCFVEFIQKKVISEDNDSGFSSALVTSGIYFSFYNTSEVKFFSLLEYFSKQMTNIFKVNKVRGNNQLNEEELFAMKSKISKQEKELYSFIKKKLESQVLNTGVNQNKDTINNVNQQQNNVNIQQIKTQTNPKDVKDKDKIVEKIENNSVFKFSIISRVSYMTYAAKFNKEFNFIGIGLKNGCILIWDCELHTDKFYLETPYQNEITNVNLSVSYCFSAALNGRTFIHSLVTSQLVYECINNPYLNLPITTLLPVFHYVSISIDISNRCCLYYLKDKHKIAKFNLEFNGKHYSLQNMYFPLVDYSKEFIIFILNNEIEVKKPNIIEMINFQMKPKKTLIEESDNLNWLNRQINVNSSEYYLKKQSEINAFNDMLNNKKSMASDIDSLPQQRQFIKNQYDYIFFKHLIGNTDGGSLIGYIKTKDIIFRCYPELRAATKNGLSIKKIMENYILKRLPQFELKEKTSSKVNMLNYIDNDFFTKEFKEKNDSYQSNKFINKTQNSIRASNLIKELSPNSNQSMKGGLKSTLKKEGKSNISKLKNLRKNDDKNILKMNIKSNNDKETLLFDMMGQTKKSEENHEDFQMKNKLENLKKDLIVKKQNSSKVFGFRKNSDSNSNNLGEKKENQIETIATIENNPGKLNETNSGKQLKPLLNDKKINQFDIETNSEKKNIIYMSYKHIQERFSYKDQRINNIQMRNARIQRHLKLPQINNNK